MAEPNFCDIYTVPRGKNLERFERKMGNKKLCSRYTFRIQGSFNEIKILLQKKCHRNITLFWTVSLNQSTFTRLVQDLKLFCKV